MPPLERGGYGTVLKALLDGPDYQDLGEAARHVFLILKLTAGPSGLVVEYPAALGMRLNAQTGMSLGGIAAALDELENHHGHWIERERHVLWVREQLRYHPHHQPSNKNHRQSIQGHVAGLPRLPIVRRFVDFYPEYFGDAPDGLLDSLPPGDPAKYEGDLSRPQGAMNGDLFGAPSTQPERSQPRKPNGRSDIDGDANNLPNNHDNNHEDMTPEQELAYEIGCFCEDTGAAWRLKSGIEEWARQIRGEPKYAGVDYAYEVRRCNEWHQNKGKTPKAPDQSIRNWLENAARDLRKRGRRTKDGEQGGEDYGHLGG